MSGKRAKERRRSGQDRRQVSFQKSLQGLLTPKTHVTKFGPEVLMLYQASRSSLDDLLLGSDGLLRVLPAREYERVPRPLLMLWAMELGYHLLPTQELVDWLRSEVGGGTAIEICAGHGVLGRALGVPCIDWNVARRFPWVAAMYAAQGQPTPVVGSHCEELEAMEAVAKYRPDVVFGGYVTQRQYPGEPTTKAGSAYGVDERSLLRHVRKYVVIGSRTTHGGKRIWQDRARDFCPSWVVSRCPDPSDQVIVVWENLDPVPVGEVAAPQVAAPLRAGSPQALAGIGAAAPLHRMLR